MAEDLTKNINMDSLICGKCNIPLEKKTTYFKYMGFDFNADLPCCPSCKQVYIPEELVTGKMQKVEMELEEK